MWKFLNIIIWYEIVGPFGPLLSLNKRALFAENTNICVFAPTILKRLRF